MRFLITLSLLATLHVIHTFASQMTSSAAKDFGLTEASRHIVEKRWMETVRAIESQYILMSWSEKLTEANLRQYGQVKENIMDMDNDSFFYCTLFPFAAYYANRRNKYYDDFQTVRGYSLAHDGECSKEEPCSFCNNPEWCIYRRGNEIVVSCRGTQNQKDAMNGVELLVTGTTKGFFDHLADFWKALWPTKRPRRGLEKSFMYNFKDRAEKILVELLSYLTETKNGKKITSVVFTGHSLGGEIAARLKDKFTARMSYSTLDEEHNVLLQELQVRVGTIRGFYFNPFVSPFPNADEAWRRRLQNPDDHLILSVTDSVCAGIQRFLHPSENATRSTTFITKGRDFTSKIATRLLLRNKIPRIAQCHDFGVLFTESGVDDSVPRSDIMQYLKREQELISAESLEEKSQTPTLDDLKRYVCDHKEDLFEEMNATIRKTKRYGKDETLWEQVMMGRSLVNTVLFTNSYNPTAPVPEFQAEGKPSRPRYPGGLAALCRRRRLARNPRIMNPLHRAEQMF